MTFVVFSAVLLLVTRYSHGIEWGASFGTNVTSYNARLDCSYDGWPTCCAMLNYTSGVQEKTSHTNQQIASSSQECTLKKVYFPSKYEISHYEKSKQIAALSANITVRQAALAKFAIEDFPHSSRWLARVKLRMQHGGDVVPTDDDHTYLSKFEITKTCPGRDHLTESWFEWIEPLTVHGRHPFAFMNCILEVVPGHKEFADNWDGHLKTAIESGDYVLLQSGGALHNETSIKRHAHSRVAAHRNHHAEHSVAHTSTHNYFFDSGTSTFRSSLNWFLCAYAQVRMLINCVICACLTYT